MKKRDRWNTIDSDSNSSSDENKEIKNKNKKIKIDNNNKNNNRNNSNNSFSIQLRAIRTCQIVQSCRSVDHYERINKIDEGSYGVVSKAKDKKTGEIVALKQVKMTNESCREGFPITALRETNILLELKHPNIINIREMVIGSTPNKIYMVMDYAENDLKTLMSKKSNTFSNLFLQSEIKCLMKQLLSGIAFMHYKWYIHRDLKTSNILYDSTGTLKICDFGLAREYGSPIRSYTQTVVTLWYRAPELLLGVKTYSTEIDMWSIGCIFAELILLKPLFPGQGELNQLKLIFDLIGHPNKENWPDANILLPNLNKIKQWKTNNKNSLFNKFKKILSNSGIDLLSKMLRLDPKKRITAQQALEHIYFKEMPLPKDQVLMPTFPSL